MSDFCELWYVEKSRKQKSLRSGVRIMIYYGVSLQIEVKYERKILFLFSKAVQILRKKKTRQSSRSLIF